MATLLAGDDVVMVRRLRNPVDAVFECPRARGAGLAPREPIERNFN
jgi:hypothetical protein